MRHFAFVRTNTLEDAVSQGTAAPMSYIAGGTNLVDLMKYDVERPPKLVDINALPLAEITELDGGGLRLGALVTNADTAYDPRVKNRYPIVSSAILAGASAQLRNAATNGGNLNQRTRCYYFYNVASPCNKREPGSGCGAMDGINRVNGILGMSSACIATHPSDMCVALAVLNAQVRVTGKQGERIIPIGDYHRLPGDEPWRDNTLQPGELVTSVELPAERFSEHYTYLKIRDRQSYAFALVSVAVVMRMESGLIEEARVALGGVAPKPWRILAAETLLRGQEPSDEVFLLFADALIGGAVGHGGNDFKIELARRALVRACHQAANGTPQSQSDKRIA
jgi:xanthine dehydrogenase YagS FAD-binding subunit